MIFCSVVNIYLLNPYLQKIEIKREPIEDRKSILIIEDEAIIAMDIAAKIEQLGYYPMKTFGNSEKALDYLSFNTPDLVLCDIMIKGSMNGIDVAKTVREKKKIPFIFLTSLCDQTTLESAKYALPYGYVIKPFTISDLSAAIEMALFRFQSEIQSLSLTKERIDQVVTIPLTELEFIYLVDLIKGVSNVELSKKHSVSINTVKSHIKSILKKLECNSRVEISYKILNLFSIQL